MNSHVYYDNGSAYISSDEIRLGNKTLSPAQVASFRIRPSVWGIFRPWQWLFLIVVFVLLTATLVLALGGVISIFADSDYEPDNPYVHDWTDLVAPAAWLLMSIVVLSDVKTSAPYLVQIRDNQGKRLTHTAPTQQDANKMAAALLAVTRGEDASRPGLSGAPVLYSDDAALVTYDQIRLLNKQYTTYTVARVLEARVQVTSPNHTRLLYVLVMVIIFGTQAARMFLVPPPTISDGRLLVRAYWLEGLSQLVLLLSFLVSIIRLYRRKGRERLYTLKLFGWFGQYDDRVVLPVDAFYTTDDAQAKQISQAIQTAINAHRMVSAQ